MWHNGVRSVRLDHFSFPLVHPETVPVTPRALRPQWQALQPSGTGRVWGEVGYHQLKCAKLLEKPGCHFHQCFSDRLIVQTRSFSTQFIQFCMLLCRPLHGPENSHPRAVTRAGGDVGGAQIRASLAVLNCSQGVTDSYLYQLNEYIL